jgi:hypothetical protein
MKRTLITALILGLGTIAPARAYTILPHLYAHTYCQLRQAGADKQGAMGAATQAAMVMSSNDWVWLTVNGQQIRSDHYQAAIQVNNRCPGYLNQ